MFQMVTSGPDWGRYESSLHKLVYFDYTGLNQEVAEYLIDSTKERFRKETSPDGTPWPKSIRAKAEGGKTLQASRVLYNSLTYRVTAETAIIGTNVKYARVHQGLTENGQEVDKFIIKPKSASHLKFRIAGKWASKEQVEIPRRAFMGINAEDVSEIEQITDERIEGDIK